MGGFDSCVHMSEEAANATKAVPYGKLFKQADEESGMVSDREVSGKRIGLEDQDSREAS